MAKLIGLAAPVKDQEVPCVGVIKIGREQKANNCPVGHASVSRQHAQIFNEGGTWVVEDLKSMNGVYVNDAKVQKQRLKDGDIVRIGDVPFKFMLVQPVTQIISKQEPEPAEDLTMPARPQPVPPPPPVAAVPTPAAPPPPPRPPPPPPPPPAPAAPKPGA
ncbi:MAG: FHA domain-containing protein, partial [Planctomycetota bacterium]|nr:FHA domain-containing protein [Planctomycetota bacterium]